MSADSHTQRPGDILINSNWIITIGMALLFAFIAFLLGWSIRGLLFDKVDYRVAHEVHAVWLDRFGIVIGAIYFFLFAYSFPPKHLKVAFLLLGAKYTTLVALTFAHAAVPPSAGLAMEIASQIAYAIILIAIVQWFKAMVRRTYPNDSGVSDS